MAADAASTSTGGSADVSDPLALEKIREEVSCAVCSELYEEPKTLPKCLHTFCKRCLVQAEEARRRLRKGAASLPVEQIECPECRTMSEVPGGPEKITTNFMYVNIVQHIKIRDREREDGQMRCGKCREDVFAPAVAFCYDCAMALCEYCRNMHTRTRDLSSHNFKSLEEIRQSGESMLVPVKRTYTCQKHPDEILKLFCFSCDVVICRDCTLMDHKDHAFNFVQEVVSSERETLRSEIEPFQGTLEKLQQARGEVERAQEEIIRAGEERMKKINTAFDRCVEEVEKRRQYFIEHSRCVTEMKTKALDHQHEEIDSTQSQLSSMIDFTTTMIETASNVEVLMYKKEIQARVESLQQLSNQTPLEVHEKDEVTFVMEAGGLAELGVMVEEPCAATSVVEGVSLSSPLQSEESTITVQAHNSEGQPLTHGGGTCTAKLSCVPAMTGVEHVRNGTVVDNNDGSYTVGFVPQYPGKASLEVFFDEVPIKGCPFEVDVVRNYKEVTLEPFVFSTPNASPWALTMLNDTELAVSASDCLVHVYTIEGEEIDTIRSNFTRPYGIWCDTAGDLWVTDREAHNVQKFHRKGSKFEKLLQFGLRGVNPGQFSHPRGITIHPDTGHIYISDMKNNRIQVFRQDSPIPKYQAQFGGPGKSPSLFNLPAGLCFDQQNRLLICDDHNCRVQVFDAEGRFLHTLGAAQTRKGLLCSPIGIACDPHGRYIITEFGSHTVTFMSPEGKILSCVRYIGPEYGQFVHPRGVACDSIGYVYVADNENMRIVRF